LFRTRANATICILGGASLRPPPPLGDSGYITYVISSSVLLGHVVIKFPVGIYQSPIKKIPDQIDIKFFDMHLFEKTDIK
jgi:hypothetical protein